MFCYIGVKNIHYDLELRAIRKVPGYSYGSGVTTSIHSMLCTFCSEVFFLESYGSYYFP